MSEEKAVYVANGHIQTRHVATDEMLDRITDLVYEVLDEFDINDIFDLSYHDLINKWIELVHEYWNDRDTLKLKLKEFLKGD